MSNTDGRVAQELLTFSQLLYTTIAVPVCKRVKSCAIAGSIKKPFLNIASKAATSIVKDENELDASEAAKLLYQPPETVASQKSLSLAMKTVYCIYNKKFWILHVVYEFQTCENLTESVNLLVCGPPYNVRPHHNLKAATMVNLMRKTQNYSASSKKNYLHSWMAWAFLR